MYFITKNKMLECVILHTPTFIIEPLFALCQVLGIGFIEPFSIARFRDVLVV
jgi:hypothetical protein